MTAATRARLTPNAIPIGSRKIAVLVHATMKPIHPCDVDTQFHGQIKTPNPRPSDARMIAPTIPATTPPAELLRPS
jgi:hypothetical protein